jgi:flagellar hook-length control protein FliK
MQFVMLNAETSFAAGGKSDTASLSEMQESGFASLFAEEMAGQLEGPVEGQLPEPLPGLATTMTKGQEIAAAMEMAALVRQKASAADAGKTPELLPVPPALPATEQVTEGAMSEALLLQSALTQLQSNDSTGTESAEVDHIANSTAFAGATADSPWLALISAAEHYAATLVPPEQKSVAKSHHTMDMQSAADMPLTDKAGLSLQAMTAVSEEVAALTGQHQPEVAEGKPAAAATVSLAATATQSTALTEQVTEIAAAEAVQQAVTSQDAAKVQPELASPDSAAQVEKLTHPAAMSKTMAPADNVAAVEQMVTSPLDNATAEIPQSTGQQAENIISNDSSGQVRAEAALTSPQQIVRQNSQMVVENAMQNEAVLTSERHATVVAAPQVLSSAGQLSFADHQKAANAADALSQKQQFKAEQAAGSEPMAAQNGQLSARHEVFNTALNAALPEQQLQSLAGSGGDKAALLTPAQQAQSPALVTQHSSAASQTAGLKTAEAQLPTLYLQEPQAAAQLKDRVMYQVQQKIQTAEIRLAPEELGSVQIKVNLQQDQLSVQFVVQQAQAKEALEQQMPRLRELLQQQGVELAESQVSQQQQQQQQQQSEQQTRTSSRSLPHTELTDDVLPQQVTIRSSDRMVDYYA